MRKKNYLSLINLKVKFHRQKHFFLINEHGIECSNFFFIILNVVSREVLEPLSHLPFKRTR